MLNHSINQSTFINIVPEVVYDAITTARGWDAFFTTGFEIDLKPNGILYFRWKDWGPNFYTTEVKGKVIKCERPELFSFEWGTKLPSTVEFHLEPKFGGTVVNLKEYGYPNNDEGIKNILECAAGWGEAITLLKFYLEHGIVYKAPKR